MSFVTARVALHRADPAIVLGSTSEVGNLNDSITCRKHVIKQLDGALVHLRYHQCNPR
jgi:hypothetical protein